MSGKSLKENERDGNSCSPAGSPIVPSCISERAGASHLNCFVLGDEKVGKSSYLYYLKHGKSSPLYRKTKEVTSTMITFETSHGKIPVKFWDIPTLEQLRDGTEYPDYTIVISDQKEKNEFFLRVKNLYDNEQINCPILCCQSKTDARDDFIPYMASFSVKKKYNCYAPITMFLREIKQDPFLYLLNDN